MEHELHQPLAVPEVDERHAAVVPAAPHPPAEGDPFAGVLGSELAARVRPHRRPELAHRIAPRPHRSAAQSVRESQFTTSPIGTSSCSPSARRFRIAVPAATSRSPRITRVRGARAVGHLELRLQGPLLERGRGGDARVPEIVDEPRPDLARPPARSRRRSTRARALPGSVAPSSRRAEEQPVQAQREPDARASAVRRAPRRARRIARRRTASPAPARAPPTRTRTSSACSSRALGRAGGRARTRPPRRPARCGRPRSARRRPGTGCRRSAARRARAASARRPCSRTRGADWSGAASGSPRRAPPGAVRGTRSASRGRPAGTRRRRSS